MNQKVKVGGGVPSNAAAEDVATGAPYMARVVLRGTSDLLFHAWSVEGVKEKAASAKGSKAKKSDNVESYVYRHENGNLGIPGENLRQTIINAAKFRQDPRSPRKSAMDLFKAALVSLTPVGDLGVDAWDYEDTRRVMIQRAGINRTRPAMKVGWKCEFDFLVVLPEYVSSPLLQEVLVDAGRLIGLCDFRPTYGRFAVERFEVVRE